MMKGTIVKEKTSLAILLIIAVICIVAVNPAQSAPITFLFTGVGSGNLNTTVFTDAAFEVIIPADTDDVQLSPQHPNTFHIVDLSGAIDISGVGIGTFVEPLYVFDNQKNSTVGFGNLTNYDLIDIVMVGVGLDAYDLTTPFGPITDLDPLFRRFSHVELSIVRHAESNIGYLTFTSMSYATFTAIPEPATVLLVGLGGVALLRRKRGYGA